MDYDALVTITQSIALILFIVMFAVVVAYAFWPGNKRKFENAARLPLRQGADQDRKS